MQCCPYLVAGILTADPTSTTERQSLGSNSPSMCLRAGFQPSTVDVGDGTHFVRKLWKGDSQGAGETRINQARTVWQGVARLGIAILPPRHGSLISLLFRYSAALRKVQNAVVA